MTLFIPSIEIAYMKIINKRIFLNNLYDFNYDLYRNLWNLLFSCGMSQHLYTWYDDTNVSSYSNTIFYLGYKNSLYEKYKNESNKI